jgi:hypothetical protein
MPASPLRRRSSDKAAALIIALAFVVLLTGLALAYFSHTTTERQLAHTSYNETSAELLARSAVDKIIGDFRQEIKDLVGSTVSTVNVNGVNVTIYTPTSAAYMVPQRNVNLAGVYNLIRRSGSPEPVAPAQPSRASAVNSMTDVSANGRYITSTRWNGHYLIPKGDVNSSDPSPTPTFNAVTPDWVFVTNQGPTPSPAPADVIGRYAYAVYDEGGLLDANLVGLPSPTPGAVTIASPSPSRTVYPARKGTVAFADLTALPLTPGGSTPNPLTISRIVGWRNYVTTSVSTSQTFPDLSPSPSPFVTYFLNNSRDFLTVSPISTPPGRTDQAFATRSELIQFVLSSIGTSANLLQYLSTFSRDLNSPTLQSATDPIARRFQLDNISLLGSSPTPSPVPGNTPIKAAFGLQWSSTSGRWQYVGTQGTTLLSAIPTPAPGGSPAPDFFQILNYAIPGQPINKILSLGAAIIDQYDDDQLTTGIEYAPAPSVAWGMENLPSPIFMGSPTPTPPVPTPIPSYAVLQRPFQNVGELGYAYNPITDATLNFKDPPPPNGTNLDAALLDFFTYNITDNTTTYNLPYPLRAGPVNINTRNSAIIAALLKSALPNEPPTTAGVPSSSAAAAATLIAAATSTQPAISRQDLARLAFAVGTTIGSTEEQKETVARALSDMTQTRTWGLLIDVIAQTGKYALDATSVGQANKFVVEGEQHYWVHVAIDRFTGQVIDRQVEVVKE